MTFKAFTKRFRLFHQIPYYVLRSATVGGFRPLGALRLQTRTLREGYWPDEAWRLGLLHPAIADERRNAHGSKRSMVRLQRRLSPVGWEPLLADKGLFHSYCTAAGIPVPPVHAIWFRHCPGWTSTRAAISGPEAWADYFLHEAPENFILKPAAGHHGVGVEVFHRSGNRFQKLYGDTITAGELVGRMERLTEYKSFIIQDRLRNHPAVEALSPGEALTAARVTTFVDDAGECRIIVADIKIVRGRNVTSNFSTGRTGNLVARVNVENGVVGEVFTVVPGSGYIEVSTHPDTGETVKGFQLPCWAEVRMMVEKAARAFLPIRAVGWDVIWTAERPMILEGNFWFDSPNNSLRAAEILAPLAGAAKGLGRRPR